MMKRAIVPLVLLVLSALTSAAQIHVRYTFSDFTVDPQGVRRMQITPLLSYTATGTNIVTGDKIVRTVNSAGSATVSNIIAGSYRVEFFGWSTTTIFTNSFGTNVSGLVDAVDYLTISTNLPNTDFAYSQSAADNLFLHKTGDAATGGLTNNSAAGFVGNGNGLTNLYRRLVSEFGAVGTADDTSTFNSAFSQVGAVIEIPFRSAGYTVGNLHITNSVTIINQGSVWYAKAGTTGALLDMHNNSNIMLRGINLQGLSTSSNYISMVPSLN
jgi:hypothetical protein